MKRKVTEAVEASPAERFLDRYTPLELLGIDLHEAARRARGAELRAAAGDGAGLDAAGLERVKAHQRLYRLLPHTGPAAAGARGTEETRGEGARGAARALLDCGLTSARQIAALPPSRFVAEHADAVGGPEAAAEVHRRAVQVRAATRHLFANVRDLASPWVRQLLGPALQPELRAYFEQLPGYQSLFGSLDYLACRDCESIFGPAAYFLDIMRITDAYITTPSSPTIPPGWTLRDRRPDLFSLPLTCASTNDPVPYVVLVVEVLLARLMVDVHDPLRALATAAYPFNLPWNEPLARTTTILTRAGATYAATVWEMWAPDPAWPLYASPEQAAPALGLSPEQVRALTTPAADDAAVAAQYGYDSLAAHLPAAGAGTLTATAGERTATGTDKPGTRVLVGQQIGFPGTVPTVPRTVRTVIRIVSDDAVEVDVAWDESVSGAWLVFPLEDLSTVAVFRQRASIAAYDEVGALLRQGLSTAEVEAGLGRGLFINATGEGTLPDLAIVQGGGPTGDPANPVPRLVGWSAARLDRLSRLLRLSRAVQLPVDLLDWLIVQGGGEITGDLLVRLASLSRLAAETGLPLAQAAGFPYALKTLGRVSGAALADPFDRLFNPASLRGERDPYAAPDPIPFDPARPLLWPPAAGPDWSADAGTAAGGGADTIVLAQGASATNDAYVGLAVALVSGTGSGQTAVVRTYAGATRTATLYAPWGTPPDTTTAYRVVVAPGVTERLAAALQLRAADLRPLGEYLAAGLGTPDASISLTLANLTALWRLAAVARRYRFSITDYLALRRLAGLPAAPPADPTAGMQDFAASVDAAGWMERSALTVAELEYVLTGIAPGGLRLAYDPPTLASSIDALARSSTDTLLTPAALAALGFTTEEAQRLFDALAAAGRVDARGVVLPARAAFTAAAAGFPVTPASFESPEVTAHEAGVAVAELRAQRPPYLVAATGDASTLGYDYPPGTPLAFLFAGVPDATPKRTRFTNVLDGVARRVGFTEFAPFLPLESATAFGTAEIGPEQSRAVFDALVAEGVLLALDAGTARLSADWTPTTPLPGLFESAAAGEHRVVSAYDGTTRTATVDAAWAPVPDAFAVYRVLSVQNAGTARAGGALTLQLAEDASTEDGAYVGAALLLATGPGAGELRRVAAYAGATRTATVDAAWDTTPNDQTTYRVGPVLAEGSARGGSTNTLELDAAAATADGAYDGCTLALVPDPARARKVEQVRAALGERAAQVTSLQAAVATARAAQGRAAAQGLSGILALPVSRIEPLLPFAVGEYTLEPFLAGLLTPVPSGVVPPAVAGLADGLSRAGLAAARTALNDDALRGLARQPGRYGVDPGGAPSFAGVRSAAALPAFAASVGSDAAGAVAYFDVSPALVGEDGKRAALQRLAGWPAAQISVAAAWLDEAETGWTGIGDLAGVRRLQPVFALMDALGADAAVLVGIARLAVLPALGAAGAGADAVWAAYAAAADAAHGLLGVRYQGADLAVASDQVARSVASAARDALLGYTLAHLQATHPEIRDGADLFAYLLIDVEMSGCDTTSRIAQGITSVQLYMQRVRMGVEQGADTRQIPEVWWAWMSAYRTWEANRKVFLYPENYLEPALRKGASPQFEALRDELMQGRPSDENAARAMGNYFDGFQEVATLTHVGGVKVASTPREGGQVDEPCFLVARTNTTPYRYFVRAFTRNLLPDAESGGAPAGQAVVWQPWTEIEATIESPEVTPVFAFDRLFLFWTEIAPTKSSRVKGTSTTAESTTESTWQARLRYTFRSSTGTWSSAQELELPPVVRVMPNEYPPLVGSDYLKSAYAPNQSYWGRPYAQQVPRGLAATGTLTFAAGAGQATGEGTVLGRQVEPGDSVWVAGEERIVKAVDDTAQTLTLLAPFTASATRAPFRVVPRNANKNRFPPFAGPGTVETSTAVRRVAGYGTRFLRDFSVGDAMQVGNETRTVIGVFDDTTLEVDRVWKQGSGGETAGPGQIGIWPQLFTVDGVGVDFQQALKQGDQLRAVGQTRTVGDIISPTLLLVTQPFNVTQQQTVSYTVVQPYSPYTVIPQTRGDERLMVFYGPNFDLRASLPVPADAGQEPNPGDDPFIAARNEFNQGLYSALRLAQAIGGEFGPVSGDLTAEGTLVLNDALEQESVRVFAPAYDAAPTPTALPVRAALDHENRVVFVRRDERPLVGLYWGNAQPGATQNQSGYTAGDLALLYHVPGGATSLVGWANQIGWYLVNTPGQSYWIARNDPRALTAAASTLVRPFWQPAGATDLALSFTTWTLDTRAFDSTKYRFTRLTTSVVQRLKGRLLAGGFDRLLALDSQALPEPPFDEFYEVPGGDPPPAVDARQIPPPVMDFDGAYGLYFWEIFFHAPLLVAQQLRDSGRFADAQRWYQYIYNPTAQPTGLNEGLERYWRFRPFREGMTVPGLRQVLTNPFEINTYNSDPFDPDAIARLRISAYAKTTVMKYVDNLIRWGDSLFALDTRESIAQATNLYLAAAGLLGKRPEVVGELPPRPPQSFDQILAASGGTIPQFLVELENTGFVPLTGEGARFADVPVNDIDAYFCVPENAELMAYWDRIDDRLFKIRHCQNLQGVERTLALFAPPIDPRSAIAAFGGEASGGGGGAFGVSPIPAYRFGYLLGLARGVTSNAIALGGSLLRALESQDAEALAQLRLEQETRVLEMNTEIRTLQIQAVDQERAALQAGRDGAQARADYYRHLLATGYIAPEIAQIAYLMTGMVTQGLSTILKTASAVGFVVPQVGSPFAMTFGGQQVGNSIEQSANALDSLAMTINTGAEVLGIAAMHERRVEEWTLQHTLAGFDVAQFDAQLASNETQKQVAQRELAVLETQIAQNAALEAFYRGKFTNQELYAWMAGRLSAAYWQTYQLALDLARMAERALQYELASPVTVVAPAWSDLRRGLTAGESLMLSLDQLEAAQVSAVTRRPLEITKTISLASIDPLAFLGFIATGEALFEFSERLFDADFPGHYRRRIRSLSVSIPAVVGPYQNVNATLTQTANRVVREPSLDAVRFLLGDDVAVPAGQIEHNVRADQRIAISAGEADAGVFDPAPDAPLLLPFEKTGAVSSWRLSMPPANNAVDLRTISDVVFELRYTATDGGARFRQEVASLPQLRERAWSETVQAERQFPAEWLAFMTGPVSGDRQRLSLLLANLVQPNVARPAVAGFYLRLVVPEGVATTSRTPYLTLRVAGEPVVFGPGARHAFLGAFERPVPLSAAPAAVEVAFDLAPGATPADLRAAEGDRLSPRALLGLELVLFLTGAV